ILLCLDTPQVRRKFMKKVSLMGMITDEYVYVLIGMRGTGFGLTGLVTINSNGTRVPLFSVYVLDTNFNQVTAINLTVIDGKATQIHLLTQQCRAIKVLTKGYTNEATTLWATRGGQRPLARPKCGYTGTDCPKPFWEQNGIYVIVGGALIGVLLIAGVLFIIYVLRVREEEKERQRLLWQIPYMQLRKPPTSHMQSYAAKITN
ncbi:hypothetical protein OSTOST_12694, partial [Ostertagia ostertagi]